MGKYWILDQEQNLAEFELTVEQAQGFKFGIRQLNHIGVDTFLDIYQKNADQEEIEVPDIRQVTRLDQPIHDAPWAIHLQKEPYDEDLYVLVENPDEFLSGLALVPQISGHQLGLTLFEVVSLPSGETYSIE
jgi:hypothetical protein